MRIRKPLRFLGRLVGLYLLVLAALYLLQGMLLYHPSDDVLTPAQYGLANVHVAKVTQTDDTQLELWYAPAQPGKPTIVYFHGNGGNLGNRAYTFRAFLEAGYGLVAVDWRGFGHSTGSPSEQGIMDDARATIRFAQSILNLNPSEMILYGESLGTGVAVRMGAELSEKNTPPLLVTLAAPYTSVAARAAEIYYYVPVNWLIRDRFESLHYIKDVNAPVLIIQGEADTVIPVAHGKALFAAANEPKQGIFLPNIGHNDIPLDIIVPALNEMSAR